MTYDADVIVVGTGPSGVSVTLPMLQAGMRVLLLDGGRQRDESLLRDGSYHDIRRTDPDQWRYFLGPRLEALRPAGPPSPKFDAPGSRFAFEPKDGRQRVRGRDFAAIVSFASGGLSNIWGGGVSTYGDEELAEFPLTAADLAPSVKRVAERIGVTGFEGDDIAGEHDLDVPSLPPVQMSANASLLMDRYRRRRAGVNSAGLSIGRPRTAVLTESKGDRGACVLCDMCVWGCRENAIYSTAHDLPLLRSHASLDYRPGSLVEEIAPVEGGYRVAITRRDAEAESPHYLTCRNLVLAAGGLVTTRLVLAMQGRFDQEVPVIGAPGIGFALLLPGRIGSALATREFSMSQLSFVAKGDPARHADGAYGSLFATSGIPASLVINRMPLTRPAAVRLYRYLQPALLFGNCFLPGRYSRSTARLERDGDGIPRLVVQGGTSDDLPERMERVKRQITRAFRRLGAFVMPGSFSPLGPGEEVRYGGSLPMSSAPGPGEVDANGEVHGSPGLHVVDLAAFPSISAKHHTLTLMANADRIGHVIASSRTS